MRDKGPRRVRRRRSGERLVSSSAFFRASAFFRIQVFWLLLLTVIDACESQSGPPIPAAAERFRLSWLATHWLERQFTVYASLCDAAVLTPPRPAASQPPRPAATTCTACPSLLVQRQQGTTGSSHNGPPAIGAAAVTGIGRGAASAAATDEPAGHAAAAAAASGNSIALPTIPTAVCRLGSPRHCYSGDYHPHSSASTTCLQAAQRWTQRASKPCHGCTGSARRAACCATSFSSSEGSVRPGDRCATGIAATVTGQAWGHAVTLAGDQRTVTASRPCRVGLSPARQPECPARAPSTHQVGARATPPSCTA